MNRTLKRPMFKMGGSAGTGITSGLDKPRQQYNEAGLVKPNMADVSGPVKTSPSNNDFNLDLLSLLFPTEKKEDKFVPSEELYKAFEGRNTKPDISQFLINFGLNLASATPRGGILSTAAQAAKKPAQALFAEQAENKAFDRSLKLAGAKLDIAEKSKIAEEARTGTGFKTSKKVYDNDTGTEVFATERDIQTIMSKNNPTEMRYVPIPEADKNKPVKVYDSQTKSTVFVNQSDIIGSKFIDDKGQEQLRYIPVPPKDRTIRAYAFDDATGEFKENPSFVLESLVLANPDKYKPVEGNIEMMLKIKDIDLDKKNQTIADQQMLAANSVAKIIRRLESDINEKGAFTGNAGSTVQFITGVSGFVDQFINKDKKADAKLFNTGYNRIEDRVTQLLNDDSINARLTRFLRAPETTAAKADIINLAYAIAKAREPGGRFSITDIDLALQSIGESSNKFNFLEGLKRVGLFTTTEALDNYVMAYNIPDEDIPVKYNALVNNNKYFKGLEVDNDIDPNSLSF
tara:strand:- start:1267 stop:2814 length:1548 start_codon:yes stop_codon:yes gene_type:complete